MAKNSKGVKNTVSHPGYPVGGPQASLGQPPTGPAPTGTVGTTGPTAAMSEAMIPVGITSTQNQPRHPADSAPSSRHGTTHSQPKHPAERGRK